MVYVYGDSHARQFVGTGRNIVLSNSFTMHKLGSGANFVGQWTYDESGISSVYLRDKPIGFPRRPAVLIFGEPDVRFAIWKQIEKGTDKIEVLETLVSQYLEVVRNLGGQIILCSITPASDLKKYSGMDGFPGWQPGFWDRKGPLEERIFYTRYLNERLSKSGLPFLDVHDHYADQDGHILFHMTHDGVHICPSKNSYIIEKLREVI